MKASYPRSPPRMQGDRAASQTSVGSQDYNQNFLQTAKNPEQLLLTYHKERIESKVNQTNQRETNLKKNLKNLSQLKKKANIGKSVML